MRIIFSPIFWSVLLFCSSDIAAGQLEFETPGFLHLQPQATSETVSVRYTVAVEKLLWWKAGRSLSLCDSVGKGCTGYILPIATGVPLDVIQGPFVERGIAPSSWIVVSKRRYSLCLLTVPKTGGVITCHPIAAPVMTNTQIRVTPLLERKVAQAGTQPLMQYSFHFSSDHDFAISDAVLKKRRKAVSRFLNALRDTQLAAKRVAAKRYAGNLTKRPNLAAAGGDGNCSWDDEGNIYCDGAPTGDGGGNDRPGSGMDGYPDTPDPVDNEDGAGAADSNGEQPSVPMSGTKNDSCQGTPIGVICIVIVGSRPPPPVDPSDAPMPMPTPWFPQSWCNFWSVFCTQGQEPRENERAPNSGHRGKTLDELYAICDDQNSTDMAMCEASYKMSRDFRMFLACQQEATDRLAACRATARQVTGNGSYPAR